MYEYVEMYDGREVGFYVEVYVEVLLYVESYEYVEVYNWRKAIFYVDVYEYFQ